MVAPGGGGKVLFSWHLLLTSTRLERSRLRRFKKTRLEKPSLSLDFFLKKSGSTRLDKAPLLLPLKNKSYDPLEKPSLSLDFIVRIMRSLYRR
jgi:hypothetical protein